MIYRLPRKQQPIIRILQGLLALGFFVRGLTYAMNETLGQTLGLPALRMLTNILPIEVWGWLWMLAGLAGIVAVTFRPRWYVVTFSLLCSLLTVWLVGYIGGVVLFGTEGSGGIGVYGAVLAAEATAVLVIRGSRK